MKILVVGSKGFTSMPQEVGAVSFSPEPISRLPARSGYGIVEIRSPSFLAKELRSVASRLLG